MVVWKSLYSLVLNLVGRVQYRRADHQNVAGRIRSRDGLDVGGQLLLSALTPHAPR